jgi:hypothetical protein
MGIDYCFMPWILVCPFILENAYDQASRYLPLLADPAWERFLTSPTKFGPTGTFSLFFSCFSASIFEFKENLNLNKFRI